MEFKITEYQAPGKISFNFEELKQALTEKVSEYKLTIYADDQIATAKKDRAELNKLKKALNDERIRQEKEFFKPFETFKAQVKELCGIIDSATSAVDAQVKAYEEAQRKQREADIKALWDASECPDWMKNNADPKWINASVSLTAIKKEMDAAIERMQKDIDAIGNLPSFIYEAEEVYKRTFSLSDAINVARLAQEDSDRRKAWEAERQAKADAFPVKVIANSSDSEKTEPARKWIGFQALLSADEAKKLGIYLKSNGIKYKAI